MSCKHGKTVIVDDECEHCGAFHGKKEEWESAIVSNYDNYGNFISSVCKMCGQDIPTSPVQQLINTMTRKAAMCLYQPMKDTNEIYKGLAEAIKGD